MSKLLSDPLSYPFDVPRCSYALADGQTRYANPHLKIANSELQFSSIVAALSSAAAGTVMIARPVGLLTCGSNASPRRLVEKLAAEPIPQALALRLELPGWIPVYAATVTGYGAIPATFEWIPNLVAEPFLVVTDKHNLSGIIASERGNYDLYRIDRSSTGMNCDFPVFAFVSHYGSLQLNREFVPLAEFQREGSLNRFPDQRSVLEAVLKELAICLSPEAYCARVRKERSFLEDMRNRVRTSLGRVPNVPGWLRVRNDELPAITSR